MAISIIANTAASYAQAGMKTRNDAVLASTQRLSSGLRVFSAKEDAAAMAVGTSLKIENSSLKTAILNASSGTSALQIADGAMGQISDMLTRMISLANQASSGHLDDPTRSLADTEFQNLKSEVDRISRNTSFGGVNMLAGSLTFTVGTGSNYALNGVENIQFDQNKVTGDATFRYSYDAATEVMTMSRIDGGATTTQSVDLTALLDGTAGVGQNMKGTEKLDVAFSQLGISFTLNSSFVRGTDILQTSTLTSGPSIAAAAPAGHAAPYFTPAATNVPTSLANGLQGLVSGYDVNSGVLTLPMTTDGTAVRLDAVAGVHYQVGSNPMTGSGVASDNLVAAGAPVDVKIFVDTPGGGTTQVGTWTSGAVTTSGTSSGSLAINAGKGLLTAMNSSFVSSTSTLPSSTLTSGPDIAAAAPDIAHSLPYFTAAATSVPTSLANGLQGLISGYDANSGVLTLPMTTDGTAVRLGAVAGIHYQVGSSPMTGSGVASNDLVAAGAPVDVKIFVDTPGGGYTQVGTWTTGAVTTTGTTSGSLAINVGRVSTSVNSDGPTRLTYKIGSGIVSGEDMVQVNVPATTLSALNLTDVKISSAIFATDAVDKLNAALTTLNQARATVGAQQLRLEQVAQNLSTQVENNETARSALLDVDVAKEITDLTSNQAMMQAASTMLAKANQMPSMLVDLLKNS